MPHSISMLLQVQTINDILLNIVLSLIGVVCLIVAWVALDFRRSFHEGITEVKNTISELSQKDHLHEIKIVQHSSRLDNVEKDVDEVKGDLQQHIITYHKPI